MKNYYYASISNTDIEPNKLKDQIQSFMVYWYAGLWVVIEGWVHLQNQEVHDSRIDALIQEKEKTKLLRDFRNSVMHYQDEFYEKRFLNMLTSGQQNVDWICGLHEEFVRFFNNTMLRKKES